MDEWTEAIRDGSIISAGESGLTLREQHPRRYPTPIFAGKTRSDVRAEVVAAIRSGDVIAAGESGLTERQLNPARYRKSAMSRVLLNAVG